MAMRDSPPPIDQYLGDHFQTTQWRRSYSQPVHTGHQKATTRWPTCAASTERAESLVGSLVNVPAAGLPFAIELVAPLREHAVPMLQNRFLDSDADPGHRLHAAVALAEFGELHRDFLVTQLATANRTKCSNITRALNHDRIASNRSIQSAAAQADRSEDWRHKARLGIVAMHLNDMEIARDMCRFREDPTERSVLIDTFPAWHGDVAALAKLFEVAEDESLRSAVCLAVGGTSEDHLSTSALDHWNTPFLDWYQNAPDAPTHSAAGWAIRQRGLSTPELPRSVYPDETHDWFVNTIGMTMVKIRSGGIVPGVEYVAEDAGLPDIDEDLVLTRSFLLSDTRRPCPMRSLPPRLRLNSAGSLP